MKCFHNLFSRIVYGHMNVINYFHELSKTVSQMNVDVSIQFNQALGGNKL